MRPAICAALGLLFVTATFADGPPAACEPGYRWVEEESCVEVVRHVCKVVPDVKKVRKVVYLTRDDPFCLRLASLGAMFGAKAGCGTCCPEAGPDCKGPYERKVLVKNVITCEEPTTKCVTQKVTQKVPCKVWRQVPCAPDGPKP